MVRAEEGSSGEQTIKEMILLTVDKNSMRADLKTWPDDFNQSKILQSFRIAIGKENGDKQKRGDNRTPEGVYFTQNIIDENELLVSKYGPRAIPLNFPNPIDRLEGKSGSGIWLPGAGNDRRIEAKNVTEGCVAFYNGDILKLTNWLKAYNGIVVIAKDMNEINRTDDVAAVRDASARWASAWANRQMDDYISHYHSDFKFEGKNRDAYRKYKTAVFGSYKNMKVLFDNMRVLVHPKYAVTVMNQDFNGDNRFVSIGRKVLYWFKDSEGRWRIFQEHFENRRFELLSFTESQLGLLSQAASSMNGVGGTVSH